MIEYKLKTIPEDFKVTEFPNLSVDMNGRIRCYILIKSGITTFDAIDILAQKYNLKKKEIGYAGLKDEEGITIQYISYEGVIENAKIILDNDCYIIIEYFANLSKHIRPGNLYGNGFGIVIRGLDKKLLENLSYRKKNYYFLNYFDSQRFGLPGKKHVTHLLGEAIHNNDDILVKKYCLEGEQTVTLEEIYKQDNINKKVFFLNSWRSFLWNSNIKEKIISEIKEYDIFTESGIDFYILTQDALRNNVDELEQCRYISQYILDNKNNEKIISNYRDVVRHTTVYIDTIDDDDIYQGKLKIQLHFSLEKGSYATMLIKHFIKEKMG